MGTSGDRQHQLASRSVLNSFNDDDYLGWQFILQSDSTNAESVLKTAGGLPNFA